MKQDAYEHAATVKAPSPRTPEGREECLRIGEECAHLWKWCYVDEATWE